MTDLRAWQLAFLKQARADWEAYQRTYDPTRPSCYRLHFNRLLPIAYEIEILAPTLAQDGSNPEYPWIDNSGRILVPVDYSFSQMKLLQSIPGTQLLKYIGHFFKNFEKLFL